MFTGLVQTVGTARYLGNNIVAVTCDHAADRILSDLAMGDSVAVDGICLTVTKILPQGFYADISPETMSRTTLGRESASDLQVNLESSLRVGSKLGGHFVTGHIDGIGYLEAVVETAIAWEMAFQVPDRRVARYIVPKGSIAVNGVSLTVADCDGAGSWFKVAVIPVTYAETNLRDLEVGSLVNLEGDVLGKYVEKFLRLGNAGNEDAIESMQQSMLMNESVNRSGNGVMNEITPTFLAEHGYL